MSEQEKQEREYSKLSMIVITLLWLWFLLGIIAYQPYMNKFHPKPQEPKLEEPEAPILAPQIAPELPTNEGE